MGEVSDSLEPGAAIGGKYVLDRRLGVGGMGTVYAAENVEIGRKVAIKVLNGRLATDHALLMRFRMEARAAALIRHPGIVDVIDMGSDSEGAPFIVMELLEGETLGALIERRERIAPARLVAVIVEALDALAAAHRAGIVHRDLKPDNLFLCRDGRPAVKLLDFGISKFRMAEALSATQTGVVMGTPLYMAPEQIRSAKDAGPETDLYAIGAICFHALTGRPPFGGDSFSEVVARAVTEPVPSLGAARPDLPPALVDLVERLLAKSPADRPSDAAAVAASLRAIKLGPPGADPPSRTAPPEPEPAPPRPSRLQGRVVAGIAMLAGAAVLGTLAIGHFVRHAAAPTVPDREAEPARTVPAPTQSVNVAPAPSASPPPTAAIVPAEPPERPEAPARRPAPIRRPGTPATPLAAPVEPARPGVKIIGDNPYDTNRPAPAR